MPNSHFPHLNIIFKAQGAAKLEGGGSVPPNVRKNQQDRSGHSKFLKGKVNAFSRRAKELRKARQEAQLPGIKGGVPFLLQIPDEDDGAIEFITEKLNLEIVAEYDDGFLIVASDDLELRRVIELANEFADSTRGAGSMAKIIDVIEDPVSESRIMRILEDCLYEKWPFSDEENLVLDVSIEVAAYGRPAKPRLTSKSKPETRAQKEAEFAAQKTRYLKVWDDKRIEREEEIEKFARYYAGEIYHIADDSHIVEFPDSFSARIRMSGKGFKDLIQNYPNLFEVTIPDDVVQPVNSKKPAEGFDKDYKLLPPVTESSSLCIIDSGIQEQHRWLASAIDSGLSRCFIPGKGSDDVADYVKGGGHGTRVAGVCLYPQFIPEEGSYQSPFWLLNARVLDENNRLQANIFPADLLHRIVSHYKQLLGTRIYQHSISSNVSCRISRMSVWAASIDLLSHCDDVLFIQAAGNLPVNGQLSSPGICDHIQQGRKYPEYLYESASRIANPAQSLQALTVGSISPNFYCENNRKSVALKSHPSSFSRSGFGMWGSIKPEVVEFGGDYAMDDGNPPVFTTPQAVCPELIRSTLNGGPPFDRDQVGTSFSAPKVAHIAGQLATQFPAQETLLYRALIVNSARWPGWAEKAQVSERSQIARSIGYGVPNLARATENTENRITLITETTYDINAKEGFVFGVPVPQELRRQGEEFKIRIDVTLSYSGQPRRTRKSRRGYLGVWLDWKASKKRELFDTFHARALKDMDSNEGSNEKNFPWTLGNKKEKDGITDGVTRRNGTVQKDWAVVNNYDLPDIFGIVVRGHKGWDRENPDATSRFALVVSFEALDLEVKVYELVEAAIQAEIRVESTKVEINA